MAKPIQDSSNTKVADPPVVAELDSPLAYSMRECSDRVAAMERELRELRARFANVSGQRSAQARAN